MTVHDEDLILGIYCFYTAPGVDLIIYFVANKENYVCTYDEG